MKDDFGKEYVGDDGKLEEAIAWAISQQDQQSVIGVLEELRNMAMKNRKLLVPVSRAGTDSFVPLIMGYNEKEWVVGYTSMETMREVCDDEKAYAVGIYDFISCSGDNDGVIINPIIGECFPMDQKLIKLFKDGCGWE